MSLSVFTEIEEKVNFLSRREQLILIERLAHNLRSSASTNTNVENQLKTMASDPEIQREIKNIEAEFAVTELDGLEK